MPLVSSLLSYQANFTSDSLPPLQLQASVERILQLLRPAHGAGRGKEKYKVFVHVFYLRRRRIFVITVILT